MKVILNGAEEEVPSEATVAFLVEKTVPGDASVGVAVALNGDVVRKAEWGTARLGEGDRIEILRAIGGG